VVAFSEAKPIQDRFKSEPAAPASPGVTKATKTAEAQPATGGTVPPK
jgi:hypothetical protein